MADSPSHTRAGHVVPVIALVLAMVLLAVAVGAAASEHGRQLDALDRALAGEASEQAKELEDYFQQSRSLTLVTAINPAYRDFYALPGTRQTRIRDASPTVEAAQAGLVYLQELFPGSIGAASFVDRSGAENARAVRGALEPIWSLSPDKTGASFFEPTFALKADEVYQARPYLSPDTNEWVLSNSAPVPVRFEKAPAMIHLEITIESFRRQAADTSGRFDIAIVESTTGEVVADSRHPQRAGAQAALGRPGDHRFEGVFGAGKASGRGTMDVAGHPSAFNALERQPHNRNRWVVVATSPAAAQSWIRELGVTELTMLVLALLLLGFAVFSFRSSHAQLRRAALSDPLTGLGNRRKLVADLERMVPQATETRPLLLGIFDLDGFKSYNDSFGHPAGDALLVRLSKGLEEAMSGGGGAYRMGGDEFCVLEPMGQRTRQEVIEAAGAALSEQGEGFAIAASQGSILLPLETADPIEAVRLADHRMYAEKNGSRASAGRQATDALVSMLAERYPDMGEHLHDVTELCARIADVLPMADDERTAMLHAASLHDIGKAAVPDAILSKKTPLTEEEWTFMQQHTVIGERILAAAPALDRAAQLVRWSHERYDGNGYPDKLSGSDIPLGARIIAVCDAFDAMTSRRPSRRTPMSREGALGELERCAGAQFDPVVVTAFRQAMAREPAALEA